MSIEKRGANSWRVQTQIRDADGNLRWIRRTLKFSPDMTERQQKRQARIAEAKIYDEAQTLSFSHCPTLKAFAPIFMERHCADFSKVTIDGYMRALETHIYPTFGDIRLDSITTEDVEEWISDLRKKNLASASVKRNLSYLNSIMAAAVKWDYIQINPINRVEHIKTKKHETSSITEEQLRHLITELSKINSASHRCACLLAIMCGMRIGEICALRRTDIDFEHKEINVHSSVKYTKDSNWYIDTTKTDSSKRTISAPDIVMEALDESCAELDGLQYYDSYDPNNNFIVHNTDGSYLSTSAVRSFWKAFAKRIGLPGIRFHDLRHSHASLLIANGIDIVTVSKRLGHTNTSTTLNIYAHALRRRDIDSANTIQSLINPEID